MKFSSWIFISIWTVVFALTFCGCAALTPAKTTGSGWLSTPPQLETFSSFLSFILPVALIAFSVGVALYFIVPEGHTLSLSLAAVAGFVEAFALLLKVTLWAVPWVAGGLALTAVGYFVYEHFKKPPTSGSGTTAPTTITSTGILNTLTSKI